MKTERGTPEWRARVGEGQRRAHESRRRRAALALVELRRFERTGAVAPSLREAAAEAEHEAAGFLQALGGPERVSEQRMALVADLARAGVLLRGLLSQLLKSGTFDLEAVSKVSTLLNVRRQHLLALGLDRVESDALDLGAYLAQAAARSGSGAPQGSGIAQGGPVPEVQWPGGSSDALVFEPVVEPDTAAESDAPAEDLLR